MAQVYAHQANPQEMDSTKDAYYLKKLSDSLRRHLSVPAQRIEPENGDPSILALYGNPVYQPQQVHAQQADTRCISDGAAVAESSQQGLQQLQHPVQQSDPAGQQGTLSPYRQLPPLRGTLRGRYKGRASEEWLTKELQKEVDDLAQTVDTFAVVREGKLCEARNAGLVAETEQLRKGQLEMQARIAGLELLIPDNNGEFAALRRELQELEKDCDIWYDRYLATQEKAGKLEAEVAALRAGAIAMPPPFSTAQQTQPGADAFKAGAPADHVAVAVGAVGAVAGMPSTAGTALPPHLLVTPEAVLAAAAFLKEKGELPPGMVTGRYPDKRAVFTRSLLLAIFLCAIAASILLTHFLTKQFD